MANLRFQSAALAACALSALYSAASVADDVASFATGGYATGIRTEGLMHKIDTNHDGMISKDEWVAFQEGVFAMLDHKKTGAVDLHEFVHGDHSEMASFATGGFARGLMTKRMMEKIDADADGTVSHDEFIDYQLKLFDMMNTSKAHQGMLSKAELFGTGGKDPR